MKYVKHFKINDIDTKQVACIELQGVPNAATEGAVGVLGMDMLSPTHEVYRCVAVNGSIYTWELLSAGMSTISATIKGEGSETMSFPYSTLRKPDNYIVKPGDLILDSEGHLYQIESLGASSCDATYCGVQFSGTRNLMASISMGGIEQVQDQESGVPEGYFKFTGKNDRAVGLDPEFFVKDEKGNIYVKYGATGNYGTTLGGKGAAPGKRAVSMNTTTIARAPYSLAHGDNTVTLANDSRAGGYMCVTAPNATGSSAEGYNLVAAYPYSHVSGFFNDIEPVNPFYTINWQSTKLEETPDTSEPIDIIGNGGSDTNRRNAVVVFSSGNMQVNGNISFRYCTKNGAYNISLVRILEELIDRGIVTVNTSNKKTDVNL